MRIEIDLRFDEEDCIDTLTTAIESYSIDYWVERFVNIKRDNNFNVIETTIEYLDQNDELKRSVLTPATIRRGIKKIFSEDFDVDSDIKQQLLEEEPFVDAECADCIIQAALFGEMIYG